MPRKLIRPGCTARKAMEMAGMTVGFLKGLKIGDHLAVKDRMKACSKRVIVKNNPPLKEGDFVEVVVGNEVRWQWVGQKGILRDYFKRDKKWGIEFQNGDCVLIMADNLKRISK